MEKICVLGAGSWGTTLSTILGEKGFDVTLWIREEDLYKTIQKTRENTLFLPGIKLAQNITAVRSVEEAVRDRPVIICVIPSHGVRDIFNEAVKFLSKDAIIVSASKGLEQGTLLTVSQILKETLPKPFHKNLSVLSGLSFAMNARAALITRGLTEMARLGVSMGAGPATFAGLSGLGDLVLTCTGELSRNRSVGMLLGKGQKLPDILSEMRMVAEGIKTSEAAFDLAQENNIEMPITEQVYRVLYENKSPKDAVMELMTRRLKEE